MVFGVPFGITQEQIDQALDDPDAAIALLRMVIATRCSGEDGTPVFLDLLVPYWQLREMKERREMEAIRYMPPYPKFPGR